VTGTDWASVKTWLTTYANTHPAPYIFDPTPDTVYGPWPRLDAVTQYKDVLFKTTLQQHANEDLKQVLPPIDSWTFQLAAGLRRAASRHRDRGLSGVPAVQPAVAGSEDHDPPDHGDQGQAGHHAELEVIELGLSEERD
jgi:hypothetical protein